MKWATCYKCNGELSFRWDNRLVRVECEQCRIGTEYCVSKVNAIARFVREDTISVFIKGPLMETLDD